MNRRGAAQATSLISGTGLCYPAAVMALPLDDIAPLWPILAERPFGLATDIDGTISHIAATPQEASVTQTAREALRALADRVSLVAAVSGRGAGDALLHAGVGCLPRGRQLAGLRSAGLDAIHFCGAVVHARAATMVS